MTALYMIKILQGSVVTQTMLGGLTIYPEVANFPPAKNSESWMTVDKVIAIITKLTFWPMLYNIICFLTRVLPLTTYVYKIKMLAV